MGRARTPTAIYVSFPDAPPPLEDTGGPQVKDISGSVLPGISKWAFSLGGEYSTPQHVLRPQRPVLRRGRRQLSLVLLVERHRLEVPGGGRLCAAECAGRHPRGGGVDAVFVWSRNLLDENYYELLTAAPGNTGLYVGQPGDARSVGITLRVALASK